MEEKTKKCVCREELCIGGAEVEIGGVCHRPNNPCYIIENQTNNRIREEWRDKWEKVKSEFIAVKQGEWWASDEDFILAFIDELLKSQREELVEKIEKHENFITMSDYDVGYNDCKENIINLIKEDK